jgi:class 3 adenylate cyclase/tetratricopeptide (TPR) repeat protein
VKCEACGRENREGAAFCDACGASLSLRCAGCSAELRSDARFCDACGLAVVPIAAEVRPPAHLAQKILRDRAAIEGERRTVTALFADAKGFTPMSEKLDAEKVYGIVQQCIERMIGGVHKYEGTVTQFTGDGIVALFGAPIAHEDSARRAVAAALDIQNALHRYVVDEGVDTAFRIGLNTGPVVVGSISDDLSMDYTAIGDTVNLAARMEQMAEPGSVYLTGDTYHEISDYFECEDLGELAVKGKSDPVRVYRARSESAVRTRLDAAVARGLSPFVGRDRDIDVLKGLWDEARAGRGKIVLISGEPGIGKSRLLLEFQRSLGEDVIWREAHCVTYGENIPYLPVVELVRNGFGVIDTDDEGMIIERVDEDTSQWTSEAQKLVPYLKFLLQVDPGDPLVENMDPMERRSGILDALRALIIERSRVAPRVVVVEDLHWADSNSEEAFRVCADAVAASAVLMILTFRPGYMHPSGDLPNAHRIVLNDLDPGARDQLANSSLLAADLSSDLAGPITRKAEGNPLFIEEVAKALAAGVTNADAVPNSLQDVILARIDRLERGAREALQFASVIGREFTLRILDRISDLEAQLEGVLGELKSLELIYEKAFFPELAYMFKHALTHDVAYSTLLVERRKTLHGIVATAIEELYEDRIAEHYETLAHHYELAEEWEKALTYLTLSGEKAAGSYAGADAVQFYNRALAICERSGDHALAGDIAHRRGLVNLSIFAIADAIADFDRMHAAGKAAGDEHLAAQGLAGRAVGEFFMHEFDLGEQSAKDALVIAEARFEDTQFTANVALAGIYFVTDRIDKGIESYLESRRFLGAAREPILIWLCGEFDVLQHNWVGAFPEAIAEFERWMALLSPQGAVATIPTGWAGAVALGGDGQYERGLGVLRDVIDVCDRTSVFPDFRARSLNTVGWIYGEIEDHETAVEWNERGLTAAREIDAPDPEFENNALLNLGDALAALGDLERADQLYREVERVVRDPRPADHWMLWRYEQHLFHSLGELALRKGSPETALGYAEECLNSAERSRSQKNLVKGLRLRGEASAAIGEMQSAERDLDRALTVARSIANPPQLWKTLAAIGHLHQTMGRDPSEAFGEAGRLIRQIADRLSDGTLKETLLRSERARPLL